MLVSLKNTSPMMPCQWLLRTLSWRRCRSSRCCWIKKRREGGKGLRERKENNKWILINWVTFWLWDDAICVRVIHSYRLSLTLRFSEPLKLMLAFNRSERYDTYTRSDSKSSSAAVCLWAENRHDFKTLCSFSSSFHFYSTAYHSLIAELFCSFRSRLFFFSLQTGDFFWPSCSG